VTVTITDLFCGAGGSSLGAEAAGGTLVMAANHWQTAIEVHQAHFPEAGHDCADISQADPRRYPRTNILLASPECTNHSQARGVSRRRQNPELWDAPDPAAERSRATMWDVPRFAEQMLYEAVVVENVVEATKWVLFPAWWQAMEALGYRGRILSHNSMHHGVPQSRDRIHIAWCRNGIDPDLELEAQAPCGRCERVATMRQAWKRGRSVGRYRQQWRWACVTCGTAGEPSTVAAATIIDWSLDCPRIGDRARPLAAATRARILAGLQRYGWAAITTTGAGNVHERTPGNRARPVSEPLPTQQTTATSALATPPGFLVGTNRSSHGHRIRSIDEPHPTVCASDDRLSLVLTNRTNGVPRPADEPMTTVCAGTVHHALIVRSYGATGPHRTQPVDEPLPAVLAGGNHHALLMRNNGGGAEMVTPVTEPARTITTAGHQSLLMPYNRTGRCRPASEPAPTVTTRGRVGLVDVEQVVDDCGFRMLEPYEVAAAMAFPGGYIPRSLPKKDQVRLAGNAVTPPVMHWIVGRVIQALEAAR
jgi:DNA (cytosine-5)-methyltransferase 1